MNTIEKEAVDGKIEIPEATIKIIQEFCSQPHIFDKIVGYQKNKELKEA